MAASTVCFHICRRKTIQQRPTFHFGRFRSSLVNMAMWSSRKSTFSSFLRSSRCSFMILAMRTDWSMGSLAVVAVVRGEGIWKEANTIGKYTSDFRSVQSTVFLPWYSPVVKYKGHFQIIWYPLPERTRKMYSSAWDSIFLRSSLWGLNPSLPRLN